MSDTHKINRQDSLWVIKEARDKPLEITFYHYTPTVLIVNQATGDVFVQNFEGMGQHGSIADEALLKNPLAQLKLKEFLAVDGEKRAFVLDSGMLNTRNNIDSYLAELGKLGVTPPPAIKANISDDIAKDLDEYKYGEIPFTYKIDLKNPQALNISVPKDKKNWANSEIPEYHDVTPKEIPTQLQAVGDEVSTLPDIKKIDDAYFIRRNILNILGWADVEQLKTALALYEEKGFDPKLIFDASDKIGVALKTNMQIYRKDFFDSSYLYKKSENFTAVIDTLNFLQEYAGQHEIPKNQIAGLTACAAKHLESNWSSQLWSGRATNIEELVPAANSLIGFAKKLVDGCDIEERPSVIATIEQDFTILLSTMKEVEESVKKTNPEFRLGELLQTAAQLGNLLKGTKAIGQAGLGNLLENKSKDDLPSH